MNWPRKRINIDNLLLDVENARHGNLDDQPAILKWMCTDSRKDKLFNLAQSIAQEGMNPIEIPLIIPAGEKNNEYIVVEGNRRISALKMLIDPNRCPNEKEQQRYKKLKENAVIVPSKEVECIIAPDFKVAKYWIEIRHTGQKEGAGTVPWGAKEVDNFAKRVNDRGRYHAAMRLLDYALDRALVTPEQSNRIPITNVTRLINTPEVRHQMGADLKKGELFRFSDELYFDQAVRDVFSALASSEWTVSKLKNKHQRESFIHKIKTDGRWGSYEPIEPLPIAREEKNEEDALIKNADSRNDAGTPTKKRSSPDSLARKTAIPNSLKLTIKNKKLRAIFNELRKIDTDKFTNSASVLTRVFIEGCIHVYCENNKLEYHKKELPLARKINDILEHLNKHYPQERQRIKHTLKGLQVFAVDKHSIGSINTFNNLVHNPNFFLTAKEIKQVWDRLESSFSWFQGHI
jgi:hypothetical protein